MMYTQGATNGRSTPMTKRKAGRRTLSDRTGEEIHQIRIMLPASLYEYVMAQPEGGSPFIRALVAQAMRVDAAGVAPADMQSIQRALDLLLERIEANT